MPGYARCSSSWPSASGSRPSPKASRSTHESHKLQALGCDIGQGYLFAKPMSKDQLIGQLSKRMGPPVSSASEAGPEPDPEFPHQRMTPTCVMVVRCVIGIFRAVGMRNIARGMNSRDKSRICDLLVIAPARIP